MKKLIALSFLISMISCSKENQKNQHSDPVVSAVPPYDTVAVDSFSAGATSMDVARQIRISSLQYQDSLKKVQQKLEEEKLLNKMNEEKEKADKKITEENKKAEETKKKPAEVPAPESTTNP
ncbi:hypothetical protein [Kaistella montana]|uniref:Lipoprotein n=1 Tax=Kaistella montana TaxID=1849733 RepID=A0ABW5K9G7_9FLAO|nr:hypothetical protein [Kaistella montana]MCQ4035878.1 hypothetical protein [Kaistella montana]